MSSNIDTARDLDDLPISSRYVYYILSKADDSLSQSEIADRGHLSVRTTRRALQELEHAGYVRSQSAPKDLRKNLYTTDK